MTDLVLPVVDCARCSLPAIEHHPRTGLTVHADQRKRPCRTALPDTDHATQEVTTS